LEEASQIRAPRLRRQPAGLGSAGGAGSGLARLDRNRPDLTRSKVRWLTLGRDLTAGYLETGPTNRLVLSLRSGLGAEVDFALSRLIPISGSDPDLLRFTDLPGLLDALLALIRDFFNANANARAALRPLPSLSHALWPTGAHEASRRRATEAALVLRNLSVDGKSLDGLIGNRRLLGVIVGVLEEREVGEEMGEMSVSLMEVLEPIASKLSLALPGRGLGGKSSSSLEGESPPLVKLFPLLVGLTRAPDRALVLLAFRTLTNLGTNDANDAVLALPVYTSFPPLPKPHPHPVETALELLPLGDAALAAAALDFVYQHTLLPANAAAFCARKGLLGVLRLICTKLHCGARREDLSVVMPVKGSEADVTGAREPVRHFKRGAARDTPPALESRLDPQRKAELLHVPEPRRAQTW